MKSHIVKERTAKADILAAIRANLSASANFDPAHSQADDTVVEMAANSKVPDGKSVVEVFCENLVSVGGRVTVLNDFHEVAASLRAIVDELGARRIAVSDSALVRRVVESGPIGVDVFESPMAYQLFDCDVGITEAQWAIAETGTLVLESNVEASRLSSLVPEVHICILDAARINWSMSEVLRILAGRLSPLVTFITGPSRTSDIELTLAIGVHGPRELHVMVVDEGS